VLSIRGRFSSAALRGVRGVFGAGVFGAGVRSDGVLRMPLALDGVGLEIPGVAATLTTLHVGVARPMWCERMRRPTTTLRKLWRRHARAHRVPCEGETP
jgi:hypothetical protein